METLIDTLPVENSPKAFEIQVVEMSEWVGRPHKHNFFEIVYIAQGSGFQCINYHEFAFGSGNIFLLPPLDCHSFRLSETTRFYFVRFTDHYFLGEHKPSDYQTWFDRMAYILANYNKVPGDIIGTDQERTFIIQTIQALHQEYLKADAYSDAIITGAMVSILNILARSIEQQYVDHANEGESRFGEILRYLNRHLTDAEKLRIPVLADRFGIAATYFSEYFKKHAGVSLAEYILKSKLRLVETKVMHTDLTVKEIAHQLNFTDSSHLARSFKNVYGMTIRDFKQSGQQCCSSPSSMKASAIQHKN